MTQHRYGRGALASLVAATLLTTCAPLAGARPSTQATATRGPGASYVVVAQRQQLTTNAKSPVAHDTETEALVAHSGRLFAATGQWEYPGPSAFGQVLVKRSKDSPWTVFEQTQSLRVQALDSFPIPSDQGLGPGHSLLVTQAVVAGQSRIQWLLDGANSFSLSNSYVLPAGADVRAFGAHESGGVWSVYAGVRPTGVLQGIWSPTRRTLVFNPAPELTVAPPGSPGAVTQKVTGFADCGGAMYTTINTTLYRRNDGALPSGHPSLGPGVPSTTGRAAQQRAPGHHVPHPRRVTVATHLDGGQRQRVSVRPSPTRPARYHGAPEPGFGRRRAGPDARVPTHPRHPSDAGNSGNDHPGHGTRLDRLRDRRLQQRRLPDHQDRRSRPAGVRVRVGLPGSLPSAAEMWTDRLRRGALQRKRLFCDPHRSEAIADLHVALSQWAHAEPIGHRCRSPSARGRPSSPSGASCPHRSQTAGSTTAATTATSTPPTARRGSRRRRSVLSTSPLRRKEEFMRRGTRSRRRRCRCRHRLGQRRGPGAGAQRL